VVVAAAFWSTSSSWSLSLSDEGAAVSSPDRDLGIATASSSDFAELASEGRLAVSPSLLD
jgi:hypothetical protein